MNRRIAVVILTSKGPRHAYFCRELSRHFWVRGIVVDDRYHFGDRLRTFFKMNRSNPFEIIRSLLLKRKIQPYERRDEQVEKDFFRMRGGGMDFPKQIPVHFSPDPNGGETRSWIRNLSPDVIAVFGTRIIREPVLGLARTAALNLHTGLSPFYRGGQCTFWCLYEGDLDHVGVTIHHLSQKIDGGDVVYTAQPEINTGDTVRAIECRLVELGTEKMIQAIGDVYSGSAPAVPQSEKGKLYLSKMYTLEKRLELEKKLAGGWLEKLLKSRQTFDETSQKVPGR